LLKSQIDSMKNEYAKIIRALYRERIYLTRLNMAFDSKDFNSRYLHRKYFREYSNYRKYQAGLINEKESRLRDVSKTLEHQKNEQAGFLAQEQANKKQLNTEKKQKEQSIKGYDKKAQDLQAQLKQKEKQARQLQQQIQRMINEEIRKAQEAKKKQQAANAGKGTGKTGTTTSKSSSNTLALTPQEEALSKDFQSNKGRLPWPVEKASVVREYGVYTHPSGGQVMNNGLQIQTSQGGAARSVFQGEVSNVSTFGPDKHKVVMIRHGDYITVYTDLENVVVKAGSKVATKQKIGTVCKNDEGKTEFNFQIWKVNECQNPRNWLAK
ncbi:MAG: peptidoglycan DD-metalloendopeptidase family protein, partial [Bacteroidales bacterium]|nr:peptidoglycan DD-metalloendopeptidase family protein [Bacteroidales bacterium]